jgi:hypothetical protein
MDVTFLDAVGRAPGPDATELVAENEAARALEQIDAASAHGLAVTGTAPVVVVVVPRSAMPGVVPAAAVLRYPDDSTPR